MGKPISISVNLTALVNAIKDVPSSDGKTKKCLIIPIDSNYLEHHSNGSIYLNLSAWEKETQYSTHYITRSFKKELRDKFKAENVEFPIMGNMTIQKEDSEYTPTIQTDSNLGIPTIKVDDMPF